MTISSTNSRINYNGNGITTVFSFPYRFLDDAHLVVKLTDSSSVTTTQVLGTDYTVSGAGLDAGGSVTMVTAPASGKVLTIYRQVPITQETDYIEGDAFPAISHESALDKLTMVLQQHDDKLDRSIVRSETSSSTGSLTLPDPVENGILSFSSSGDLIITQELGKFKGTDATITTTNYKIRDLVKSSTPSEIDNVYLCIQDSPSGTSLTNTTYWELIVDNVNVSSNVAANITNVPAGNISATDLQDAINELDTEKEPADSTILKDADINNSVEGMFNTATAKHSPRALDGHNVILATDFNLRTVSETGFYEVNLTAIQNGLPIGNWFVVCQFDNNNNRHLIAKSIGAGGTPVENTYEASEIAGVWVPWVNTRSSSAYTDETASRAKATSYTNTEGKEIGLFVECTSTGTQSTASMLINGTSAIKGSQAVGVGGTLIINARVPNNQTYKLQEDFSTLAIVKWWELK